MIRGLALTLMLFSSFAWAGEERVTLAIDGMTCPLCVTTVNQALRKTDGVIKAKASLKTRRAEVIVPEQFDLDLLLQAIEKTGYSGSIEKVEKRP